MATELGTAYVSIVAETSKLEQGIKTALNGGSQHADLVGKDIGSRISASASKAMKNGWRPDQDIMAGIPDTKADRIGARIGQVIGKGISTGLRAREAGIQFGHSFTQGAGSVGLGSVIAGWRRELSGNALQNLGMLAGKTLSMGLTLAAGAAVGGIGLALTKGFDRLEKIDSAKAKLKAMKMSTQEVADTVKLVTDSVTGTPFSLDAAFNTATMAIGAGVKDIKRFMTDVTDAAGFAGVDLDRMGIIFTQIQAKGKLTGEEMMQLMEAGVPAKSWIEESYNLTSDQFDKMQQKGQITMEMLQTSIEQHAGGMAKNAGETLQGSIANMQTAIARVGADFLSAIFGGNNGDSTEGMKDAINRITEALNKLDNWVKDHREDIKEFFRNAKDIAGDLLGILGKIAEAFKEHPGLIKAVAAAFVAWKAIEGVAALSTALTGISTLLRVTLPADAVIAGTGIAAGLAKALPIIGSIVAAYALGDTNPAFNAPGEPGPDGSSFNIGPDKQIRITDKDGNVLGGESIYGGPGAQRQRRGVGSDFVGGGGDFGGPVVAGAPGRGYPTRWRLGSGPEGWRPAVQQAIAQYGPTLGITNTKAWEDALVRQIQTESGGNPFADNPNDSNGRGGKQHVTGLLQFLPETFASHNISGGGYTDPHAQIAAALDYVVKRYGMDANGAPLQIGRGVGYDSGGWLQPGTTIAQNNTGKPEAVFTQSQLEDMRTAGAIPAAAGSTAKAGDSAIAKGIGMGGEFINGLIDQAASAASQAASVAAAVGTAGGGAAGGPGAAMASQFAISALSNSAKRGVKYGFEMAGIGADAILQQLTPFGMPRWLTQDYSGFMPQWDTKGALGDLMTSGAAGGSVDPNTTQHGMGQGAAPGPSAMGPEPLQPSLFQNNSNSFLSTELAGAEAPAPDQQPMFKIDNVYTQNVDEFGRELNKQGRLAAMQYANRPGP